MRKEVSDFLKLHDVKYKENYKLKNISTVKIGEKADFVVYPDSERKLLTLVRFLTDCKIKHKILGRMSNVLPSDERYEGVIVRTDLLREVKVLNNRLDVACGAAMPYVAKIALDAELSGFEGLSGIPGSIAGAIVGNAGAYGVESCERLISVRVFYPNENRISIVSPDEAEFGYRSSVFKSINCIILSASFGLVNSDYSSVKLEMDRIRERRLSTQPTEPSLGSCFKRPERNIFAARLIDECGLKGYSVGDAEISRKHAGFIVNRGNATAKDYISLLDYAAKTVYDRFGVRLEREIEFLS